MRKNNSLYVRRVSIAGAKIQAMTAALAGCLLLSGCYAHDVYRIDPLTIRGDMYSPGGGVTKSDARAAGQGVIVPFNLDAGKIAEGEKSAFVEAAADSSKRNNLMDHLIGLSNQFCGQHKSEIIANAAVTNLTLSSVTTVLGGAGAIFTGATAARVLSGSAATTNAIRSNVNEQIYANMLAGAVIQKIDELREKKRMELNQKRGFGNERYSAWAMLDDVSEYHEACSFYAGLSALADKSKRIATADEIRGRIDALKSQRDANDTRINQSAVSQQEKITLQTSNESLAKAVQQLQLQLTLLSGAEVK